MVPQGKPFLPGNQEAIHSTLCHDCLFYLFRVLMWLDQQMRAGSPSWGEELLLHHRFTGAEKWVWHKVAPWLICCCPLGHRCL